MIPATRRRPPRNKLQQQRSRNGKQWEEDLCEELNAAPNSWARCWPKAWAGQPFDISAMVQGAALGIECKAVQRGNLPFSALRPNEIENLSRFEDAGGAALIAVRRAEPPTVAFIPSYKKFTAPCPSAPEDRTMPEASIFLGRPNKTTIG